MDRSQLLVHPKAGTRIHEGEALKQGRTITHHDEMREIRSWRLGAIIHRLRREFEWPIVVEYRGPEKVAYYALHPDADHSKLRLPKSAKALGDTGGAA